MVPAGNDISLAVINGSTQVAAAATKYAGIALGELLRSAPIGLFGIARYLRSGQVNFRAHTERPSGRWRKADLLSTYGVCMQGNRPA